MGALTSCISQRANCYKFDFHIHTKVDSELGKIHPFKALWLRKSLNQETRGWNKRRSCTADHDNDATVGS